MFYQMNQMYPSLHGLKLSVIQMFSWHGRCAIDMIDTIGGNSRLTNCLNHITDPAHLSMSFSVYMCYKYISVYFKFIYLFLSISGFITYPAA